MAREKTKVEAERIRGQEGGVVTAVGEKTEEKGKGVVKMVQDSLDFSGKKG